MQCLMTLSSLSTRSSDVVAISNVTDVVAISNVTVSRDCCTKHHLCSLCYSLSGSFDNLLITPAVRSVRNSNKLSMCQKLFYKDKIHTVYSWETAVKDFYSCECQKQEHY